MLSTLTPRLQLRPHALQNAEKLNAWENDPELLYTNDDQPEDRPLDTLENTRQFIQRAMDPRPESTIFHYALHTRDDDRLIGYGMVASIDRYNRRCKLGIVIGEKEEWGTWKSGAFSDETIYGLLAQEWKGDRS